MANVVTISKVGQGLRVVDDDKSASIPGVVLIDQLTGKPLTGSSSMGLPAHDYLSYASGVTTDTYTYKLGGAAGTTVATRVITYTDATKAILASVAQT